MARPRACFSELALANKHEERICRKNLTKEPAGESLQEPAGESLQKESDEGTCRGESKVALAEKESAD